VIKLGALASQAIVPFIPSQHIIQAMNKKTIAKCTKAGHENPKTSKWRKLGTCTPDRGSGATLGVLGYP